MKPLVLALCGLAALGCGRPLTFEGLRAPTLGSAAPRPLDACPAAKCLTVYVAPWCPHCRAATPMILALRDHLRAKGVETRVIVGLDGEDKVRAYARTFGPDTFLDVDGRLSPPGGVPAFLVSLPGGRVVGRRSGAPELQPPFTEEFLAEVAAAYGLP